MRSQGPQIHAVEQPVQLLPGQCHQRFVVPGPGKAITFQAFLPQAEAVALPVENLDPVAAPIAEHEQVLGEGIELQAFLDQYCQAIDTLPEIDRIPAQVHHGQVV